MHVYTFPDLSRGPLYYGGCRTIKPDASNFDGDATFCCLCEMPSLDAFVVNLAGFSLFLSTSITPSLFSTRNTLGRSFFLSLTQTKNEKGAKVAVPFSVRYFSLHQRQDEV